ncbi:LysE family translocator [Psychrobacter alimentarius]|uniref:LysE family translocator n=1 Tax=Psychrobacter alimentarius TaxID=261164 RepID=UPI00191852F2|nr:LysE family transporter [Psychrobacter alimentarius]
MNWDLLSIFITVGLAHFLALLSPGPDFVLIVKSAIKNDSKDAIGVALGITSANAVYIGLCLIGVGSILAASAPIMIILKIIGGLFLMYLGLQALRARKDVYDQFQVAQSAHSNIAKTTFLKEFTAGFLSGIFNPKNLLFYLSLFTVVLTPEISFMFKLGLGIWMTVVVFAWDTAVIFLLSTRKVRAKFTQVAYYIDKVTGALLGVIGLTIVRTAIVDR